MIKPRAQLKTKADIERCVSAYRLSIAETLEFVANNPSIIGQMHYAMLACNWLQLSRHSYLGGFDLQDVRHALFEALSWYIRVFEHYNTEKRQFPAIDLTKTDPSIVNEKYILRAASGEIDTGIDNAYTGSEQTIKALHLAIIVGTQEMRGRLVKRIDRVIEAETAIGSEHWSKPVERRIVEHLMDYLGGAARRQVRPFGDRVLRGNEKELWFETQAHWELGRRNCAAFLCHLDDWLEWYDERARDERNLDRSEFYFSLSALACCRIALDDGLVQRSDLPGNNVYLPLDLLEP
jgi:hypothetical protein